MKRLALVVVSLVSIGILGIAGPAGVPGPAAVAAAGADPVIEVYPTGLHPQDSLNVQSALDTVASPGTVVMKATDPSGTPLSFNFGGDGTIGSGAAIKLLRPGITLTGDGWDDTLDEPRTKILGGGGPFRFSPTVSGVAMVFAINAPGVTLRELKLTTSVAYTGVWVTSALQPASDLPVRVERNDFRVLAYHALITQSAGFPVRIDGNVFHGPVSAQWIGFTLRPIAAFPFDELVVPVDVANNMVRHSLEFTNNRLTVSSDKTLAMVVNGWANAYCGNPDPEAGCRRLRPDTASPWVYQHVQGDNGPVLISGNDFIVDSPDTYMEVLLLGAGAQGLNHAVVKGNRISGRCSWGVSRYPWGHDVTIADNDLSGARAYVQMSIEAADTTVTNNLFGPIVAAPPDDAPPPGIPQPALALLSVHYNASITPRPNPVERCFISRNDYRRTGSANGVVLLASEQETDWYGLALGWEVKSNIVFEAGRFPVGTGGARDQIFVLANMINPLTGLPYVYDNRIVGHPAKWITGPGIGQEVRTLMRRRGLVDAFMDEY